MLQHWMAALAGTACAVGMVLHPNEGQARPEYTRRTKKECLYCHPPDSFRLTDAGEYYREHRTLEGYKPKEKAKYGDPADSSAPVPSHIVGAAGYN